MRMWPKIRRAVGFAVLLVATAGLAGCSTAYWSDRGRDAADIFTATVGVGFGARARVGPLHAGLFYGGDKAGLRGGELRSYSLRGDDWFSVATMECTVFSAEHFGYAEARGKDYGAFGYPLVSFVCDPKSNDFPPRISITSRNGALHPYYTQIEIEAGLFGGIRLGFNPGELLDFILGWTTIDIFKDDIGAKAEREHEAALKAESEP